MKWLTPPMLARAFVGLLIVRELVHLIESVDVVIQYGTQFIPLDAGIVTLTAVALGWILGLVALAFCVSLLIYLVNKLRKPKSP